MSTKYVFITGGVVSRCQTTAWMSPLSVEL